MGYSCELDNTSLDNPNRSLGMTWKLGTVLDYTQLIKLNVFSSSLQPGTNEKSKQTKLKKINGCEKYK